MPAALPTPPGHLYDEAVKEWNRVAKMLYAIGVLTELDRAALAIYCQAYGRWVRAERALDKIAGEAKLGDGLVMKTKAGNLIQNPLVGTANKAMDSVLKAAAELGMTPSMRTRIEVSGGKEKENPAAKYFNR